MKLELTVSDLRIIHESLSADEARRVKLLVKAVADFDAAPDKAAYLEGVRGVLEAAGARGVSVPSFYRKARLWRSSGQWTAVVDGRTMRRINGPAAVARNAEFRDHWVALALSNRRKTSPAYRQLFRELAQGEYIPGFGTWRDIWAKEHEGVYPPDGMPCPYRPYSDVPEGWSEKNLRRLLPSKFAVAAARQGPMAAQMAFVPDVRRTRVGLAPCQCVQMDDMWHEVKVAWEGNKHAQRVVDLSMSDVLTAKILGWLCFPVREGDEGRRETFRSEWTRYLLAHLLCDVGIPEAGCLVMGEHGTATAGADLVAVLAEVSGGRVRFGAGGILSKELAAGLYGGRPKGNPRYKGLLEGLHGLVKNELGAVRGHVGGGRGREPEEAYGMDLADERLRRIAGALEKSRPGILSRLSLPYMPWADYCELARTAYDEADGRTWHRLEGWEECGFTVGEWRPTKRDAWQPMDALDRMSPRAAEAFRALVADDADLFRMRRMSPREAFASRAGELERLDEVAAILVMGPKLARPCRCDDRLQLDYRDDTTLRRLTVAGVLADGRLLERGRIYQVWHNPLNPSAAYVSAEDGRYLGMAPVMAAANHDDSDAIARQLGVRQKAIAAEAKGLAPYIRRRQAEAAEAARRNAEEILGADPAMEAALAEAAEIAAAGMARGSGRVDLDDLVCGGKAPAGAGGLDDIL